ncbi:MAG TPA: STAS domain-containing protein [Ilumatobacteraceae bacterium]
MTTSTAGVETSANEVTVTVSGELDMADADEVGEILTRAAAAGRAILRVDLSGLTFADSSAIKALLVGAKAAEANGVDYQLVNPHGNVQRLLSVTGLTEALTVIIEPDEREGPNSL